MTTSCVVPRPALLDLFGEVSADLVAKLAQARSALAHRGNKGDAAEEAFREFLSAHLPEGLGVCSGELIDLAGRRSGQLDVIIFDRLKAPTFYRSGSVRVLPAECAYAVIEVKASLDSSGIDACVEHMRTVKQLQKPAFFPDGAINYTFSAYGQKLDHFPILYFVFAFESTALDKLGFRLKDAQEMHPVDGRVDSVYVLKKGAIVNRRPDGTFDAAPVPGSELRCCKTEDSLLMFILMTARYLNTARMASFRLHDYLKHVTWGTPPEVEV